MLSGRYPRVAASHGAAAPDAAIIDANGPELEEERPAQRMLDRVVSGNHCMLATCMRGDRG